MVIFDCKTVWRFWDRCTGKRPLYLVSAWPTAQALVLTPDAIETWFNEFATFSVLLGRLESTVQVVTINAMSCRSLSRGGHG